MTQEGGKQNPDRQRLTDTLISKLPVPQSGRPAVYDQTVREFCVRLSPAGGRAFYVYKRIGKLPAFIKIGTHPNMATVRARTKARKVLADIEDGINPNEQKRNARGESTLGDLWDEYLTRHLKPNRRRWETEEGRFNKALKHWKGRTLSGITRRDVIELLDGIVDRGSPVTANRVHALLRGMFNFAIQRDLVGFSPVHGISAPAKEYAKDRVLSEQEIRDFWHGLDNTGMFLQTRQVLRLILITMQRPGEVAGMLKDELDLKTGWWNLPGERVKNHKAHRVPLSGQAIEIIKSMPKNDWPHIFPAPRSPSEPITVNVITGSVRRSLRGNTLGECKPFSPHDLRRTGASLVRSPRISEEMVGMILNHSTRTITGRVYSLHHGDEEKRRVEKAWERNLREILQPPADNVVQLAR